MTFGARLKTAREQAGMTQTDLGKGLGTDGEDASKSVVLGWEKDRHFPRVDQLMLICARLGCSAEWLMFGKGAMHPGWPFSISFARFKDLTEKQQGIVEGRLIAAIEECESGPAANPEDLLRPATGRKPLVHKRKV